MIYLVLIVVIIILVYSLRKEKLKERSLYRVTHEIKNSITVINGYISMFDYDDKNKSKKYINILKRELKKELVLLNDFLSSNKITLNKEIVDLNLLLEEVIESFKPLLVKKNINLISHISKEELLMYLDYDKLCEVISNLIKNSIESIDSNGIIEISVRKVKDKANIIIKDNGLGMTKKEIKKIFIPFYTTKRKGTGLGTYISKIIIEKHNGNIKYESIKNKGTKTLITLPINKKIMYN